jgi:putative SOS response-associated peptidase YedK
MCGRFVSRTDAAIERTFNVTPRDWRHDWASYNVAPTQPVPVIRTAGEVREGVMLRWGLIPFWAKGEPTRYSTINARAETIDTAASYRGPWRQGRRCLIPAVGYFEWQAVNGGKQAWFIRLAGGEAFAFAGLWEQSTKADGTVVETCTIITVPANPMVAEIHAKGRMPAMLEPQHCQQWLLGSVEEARATLATYPAEQMDAYRISSRVNSPRNNAADLLEPIN